MRTEKIFPQPDGSKLRVELGLTCNPYPEGKSYWSIRVFRCEKGKRTWFNAINEDSLEYRHLSFPEGRNQHIKEQIEKLIHGDDIFQMKSEYAFALTQIDI